MARTIQITLPSDKTDRLAEALQRIGGIVGISVQRGASLKPPGDVLIVQSTNEGLADVLELLARHRIGAQGTVVTSEPRSLVSPSDQRQIDIESNDASWPEMAALLRRETNLSSNYLMAMCLAGVVAAAGLWTDTVHIVVGAMIMAPGFEPIIRVPFGLLAKGADAWKQGLKSSAAGYAVMIAGALTATLVLTWLDSSSPELAERHWIRYWSQVTLTSVLVALAASAAGAAIIAAQRSVLTAGVMVALALVPSAAIVGMAIAAGNLPLAAGGLARWMTDTGCVVIGGGLVFLIKHRMLRRTPVATRESGPLA